MWGGEGKDNLQDMAVPDKAPSQSIFLSISDMGYFRVFEPLVQFLWAYKILGPGDKKNKMKPIKFCYTSLQNIWCVFFKTLL